jgi:hypothetical protein
MSPDLSLSSDLGPPSSICPSYTLPLAAPDLATAYRIRGRKTPPVVVEDGGRRPPSPRPESRTVGGCLRGRASHAHGPPCLQAPRIHAAVEEEDPRRCRSRRRTCVVGRHTHRSPPAGARHQRRCHGPGRGSSRHGGWRSATPCATITQRHQCLAPTVVPAASMREKNERTETRKVRSVRVEREKSEDAFVWMGASGGRKAHDLRPHY